MAASSLRITPRIATPDERSGLPVRLTVLEVLLEMIEASVFVLSSGGRIVVANARGTALLAARGEALRDFLDEGARGASGSESTPTRWAAGPMCGWRRPFAVDGGDVHSLVVVDEPRSTLDGVAERAVRAWGLTSRQADVFRLVLEGLPNKDIATRLKLASRTVEVHITTLFEKAGVESRARLIAKTWDLAEPMRSWPLRL